MAAATLPGEVDRQQGAGPAGMPVGGGGCSRRRRSLTNVREVFLLGGSSSSLDVEDS